MTTSATNDQAMAAPGAQTSASSAAAHVPLSLREGERSALRPAVAIVEDDLARLEAQRDVDGYAQAAQRLTASWHSLVSLMALGTAPEMRSCPHCGYRIFAKATRCVQCWKHSDAA
jgi:hypothetical protein